MAGLRSKGRRIFNRERCGFYINAAFEPMLEGELTLEFLLLNKLKQEIPSHWPNEPFDALTYRTAREYFRLHEPRIFFVSLGESDATSLCERLPLEAGVVAIPTAAFSADPGGPTRPLVRFAFPKGDAVLDEAIARLARWSAARAERSCPGALNKPLVNATLERLRAGKEGPPFGVRMGDTNAVGRPRAR